MALGTVAYSVVPLRTVLQRLSSTPLWQVPQVTPILAGTIAESGSLLSTPRTKLRSEDTVLVHKLKTRISALLQDKDPRARWAAVVFVKAIIEAGGYETLQGAAPWVGSIITILGKPDPVSTKKLCVITLTRIMLLTQGHQSLMREVTNPHIPAFITACLSCLTGVSDANLASVILQALGELLPYHPSSFRPFVVQIKMCVLPLIAATPANTGREPSQAKIIMDENVADNSRRLFILLCYSAPKKTESEAWAGLLRHVVDALHATADRVFRSLVEDRDSSFSSPQHMTQSASEKVRSAQADVLGLPGWTGIDAGIERLEGLLKILKAFFCTATRFTVASPVGLVIGILNRVLSLIVPANVSQTSGHINQDFGRDERDSLLLALPKIHALSLGILSSVTGRLGVSGISFYASTLQHLRVVNVDDADVAVRMAVYKYLEQVLNLFGLSTPLRFKATLSECVRHCCKDLLQQLRTNHSDPTDHQRSSNEMLYTNGNIDSRPFSLNRQPPLQEAQLGAEKLLPLLISHLPNDYLANSARIQIDQTAVLTHNEETMLVSTLYAPERDKESTAAASILPFLARASPISKSTEALIRPRMPTVQITSSCMGLHFDHGTESDIQEGNYAQLHSGNGTTEQHTAVERGSFVEDSMPSEKQPPALSFESASADLAAPAANNTQKTEISVVEVPETQPMTVTGFSKRAHDTTFTDVTSMQSSHDAVDKTGDKEGEPVNKKQRTEDLNATTIDGLQDNDQEQQSIKMTEAPPAELSIPVGAAKPMPSGGTDSDSDDSSIHIDPTLDTDEEDEDDDEDQSLS